MRRNSAAEFARAERGTVTIEFVVTLPLFLVALAFAFEFGQFFLAHQSTVNNVRAASRYLSRTDATRADRTRAESIVRTGQIAGGTAPGYLADATVDVSSQNLIDPDDQDRPLIRIWRISARVGYQPSLFGFFGGDNAKIPFVVREDIRIAKF